MYSEAELRECSLGSGMQLLFESLAHCFFGDD